MRQKIAKKITATVQEEPIDFAVSSSRVRVVSTAEHTSRKQAKLFKEVRGDSFEEITNAQVNIKQLLEQQRNREIGKNISILSKMNDLNRWDASIESSGLINEGSKRDIGVKEDFSRTKPRDALDIELR